MSYYNPPFALPSRRREGVITRMLDEEIYIPQKNVFINQRDL